MQTNCICRTTTFHRDAAKITRACFQTGSGARVCDAKPTCRAEAVRRRRFGPQQHRPAEVRRIILACHEVRTSLRLTEPRSENVHPKRDPYFSSSLCASVSLWLIKNQFPYAKHQTAKTNPTQKTGAYSNRSLS